MDYRLLGVGEEMIASMTWLVVVFAHFVGDYALQSSWMAVEKKRMVMCGLLMPSFGQDALWQPCCTLR